MARKSVRVKKAHPHAAVANEFETLTGQEATAQQQAVAATVPAEGFTAETGFSISSGPYVDGTTVTITRSSGTFGAKDHQATTYFSNFAAASVGQSPPSPWATSDAALCFITDARAYSGGKAIRVKMDTGVHSGGYFPINTEEVYTSVRYWWEQYNSLADQNIKVMFLSSAPNVHSTEPSISTTFGPGIVELNSGGANGQTCYGWGTGNVPTGQWNRDERFMRLGDVDVENGIHYVKVNQYGSFRVSWMPPGGHFASPNGTVPHTTYWGSPQNNRNTAQAGRTLRSFFLPFYKRGTDRCDHWVDEVYIDTGQNAQARIELGNTAFGTDSRPRNPCPYSAWATGSITVTLNAGPNGIVGRALYFVGATGVVEKIGEFV